MSQNTYDMRGLEADSLLTKINSLSQFQRSVFDSVERACSLHRLYNVHGYEMPQSSVRRILYTLRDKKLIEKLESGKWRQIRYART